MDDTIEAMEQSKSTALVPYDDLKRMAEVVVKGGLFKDVVKTPEEALTLMLVAQAENIHPMAALSRYSIIQGRPAKKSAAMLADFKTKGGTFRWLSDGSNGEAVIELHTPGAIEPILGRFSMDEAKAAGLVRQGSGWEKFPKAMLQARAVSAGMRMADPASASLYTPEEVADFEPPKVRTAIRMPERVIEAQVLVCKCAGGYFNGCLVHGEAQEPPAGEQVADGQNVPLADTQPAPGVEVITEAEAKALWKAVRAAKVQDETFRWLLKGLGYESTKELPRSMLQDVLKVVQEGEETAAQYARTLCKEKP